MRPLNSLIRSSEPELSSLSRLESAGSYAKPFDTRATTKKTKIDRLATKRERTTIQLALLLDRRRHLSRYALSRCGADRRHCIWSSFPSNGSVTVAGIRYFAHRLLACSVQSVSQSVMFVRTNVHACVQLQMSLSSSVVKPSQTKCLRV